MAVECTKLSYGSERGAKAALANLRAGAREARGTIKARRFRVKRQCRVYLCPLCEHWHLTHADSRRDAKPDPLTRAKRRAHVERTNRRRDPALLPE